MPLEDHTAPASSHLKPPKMSVRLETRVYPGATFGYLVHVVHQFSHNLNKAHSIESRHARSIALIFSPGKWNCNLTVNASKPENTHGIKLVNFEHHTCVGGPQRERQIKSKVLARMAPTIHDFVPNRDRSGGKTNKLQEMATSRLRTETNSGMSFYWREKGNGRSASRVVRFAAVVFSEIRRNDADRTYKLEVKPVSGEKKRKFERILVVLAGVKCNWRHYDGMASIDATFLAGLTQGILFTASCYYANKKLTLLAFAIARTGHGTNRVWSLQYCTDIFTNIRALVSDGAKELESSGVKELWKSSPSYIRGALGTFLSEIYLS